MEISVIQKKALIWGLALMLIFPSILILQGEAQDFVVDENIPAPSITEFLPSANSVQVSWQASSLLATPDIRVDSGGKGDISSIAEALAIVQQGLVAVSNGSYTEIPFSIPAGVTLQGGYDPLTWTWSPEGKTILQNSGGGTFISLGEGTALKGFVVSSEEICIKNLNSGAIIGNNVLQLCETGLELGANSYTEVVHNTFLGNKVGVHLSGSARIKASENLFSGVGEAFKNESTNEDISLGEFVDASPPELGLDSTSPFPPDSGPETSVEDWEVSLDSDASPQDLVSKVLRAESPFTAMYLTYHLAEGDRFSIHAKDRYDLTIFDSNSRAEKSFEGWVPVEETQEIRLRLRTNGDGQLATYSEEGAQKQGNLGRVKALGAYTMPNFQATRLPAGAEKSGATGFSEDSTSQLSFPAQPERMPSFENILLEEAKVAYLEELINLHFKEGDDYVDRIILEGSKWKSFSAWPKYLDQAAEYISKAPYEVTDGRSVDSLLSSVFASAERNVRRVIIGSRGGKLVPIALPQDTELKNFLEEFENVFLTTLTEWLKYRLQDVCFSDEGELNRDCAPYTDFKYFVKPLTRLGEQDCVEATSCPLSPLQERVLEIHPFGAFLNRMDLYDYEQENYPVAFYKTNDYKITIEEEGLRVKPDWDPVYTGGEVDYDINDPGTVSFTFPTQFSAGRFQVLVKDTYPAYGKRAIVGIGDTRYDELKGGGSPFDAWRNWIEMMKYAGVTAGKVSSGNEDAYEWESFASYAGWDRSRWYNLSIQWGDGKAILKREPLESYGAGPVGNDLLHDDAGGRVADNGRRHPNYVPALVWEYPGKLTADHFWLASPNELGGVPVSGLYNDVRIFAGEEDLLSEMYLRHDTESREMLFEVAKMRGAETYSSRDHVPQGVINGGEIYAHIDGLTGFSKILFEDGASKLELAKKVMGGEEFMVLSKEEQVLAKTKWPRLSGSGRIELKWTYNQKVDQTSFFVYYSLDNEQTERLLLSNTGAFDGHALQGMFVVDSPKVRVMANSVGPAKLVLRHADNPKTVAKLEKQQAMSGSEQVPDQSVGYKVYLGQDRAEVKNRENGIFVSADELRNPSSPSYTIQDLEENQRYYLALSTVIVGEENKESNLSEMVSFMTVPEFDFMPPEPRPAVVDQAMRDEANANPNTNTAWSTNLVPRVYAEEESSSASTEIAQIYEIALGESLILDGSLSEDLEGGQLNYEWSLGNTPHTSFEKSPEKTFVYPGTYFAQYKVKDDQGASKIAYSEPLEIEPPDHDWVKAGIRAWLRGGDDPWQEWGGVQEALEISSLNPPVIGPDTAVYLTGEALDLANVSFVPTKITWDLDGKILSWDAENGLQEEGSDRIIILNSEEIEYLPNTLMASSTTGGVLQKTPIKVEYKDPSVRVISLMLEDERGKQGVYQYTLNIKELEIYPKTLNLSAPQGGFLTIQGGTPPFQIDGQKLELGTYRKFVTFQTGTEVLVEDAVEKRESAVVEQGDVPLNKLPEAKITFEKLAPVKKMPLKVRFKVESSDEDGYITEEGPWFFGDQTPHPVQDLLPEVLGGGGASQNPTLETGPFEYMGRFFASLQVTDRKGNSKSRTVLIKVGPPDFSMRDVLGVTTSAVSRIEFLRAGNNRALEIFASTVPDENGIFLNPTEEKWLGGKSGEELKQGQSSLFRVFNDYTFQKGEGVSLQPFHSKDELKVLILKGAAEQGELLYKRDPNEDLKVVEAIDHSQKSSHIEIKEGLSPTYKGLSTEFYRGEEWLFTFFNQAGLELAEGLTLKLKEFSIEGTDLFYLQFEIWEENAKLATLSLQPVLGDALPSSELTGTGENEVAKISFPEYIPGAGEEVYVAIYDNSGHRYLYPDAFKLPTAEESLQKGVIALADNARRLFFDGGQEMVFAGSTLSLFGVLDPEVELEISLDSGETMNLTTNKQGAFKTILKDLEEGKHSMNLKWGKKRETYKFEIDQTPPAEPQVTGLQAGRIVFGKAEPGSMVVGYSYGPLQDTAKTEVLADGSFVLTFTDRSQKYKLLAYDAVQNFSQAVEVEFAEENVTYKKGLTFTKVLTYLGAGLLLIAIIGLIRNKRKSNYWE